MNADRWIRSGDNLRRLLSKTLTRGLSILNFWIVEMRGEGRQGQHLAKKTEADLVLPLSLIFYLSFSLTAIYHLV